jgi:plastocyanin
MNQLLLAALIGLQAPQPVATGAIQGRVSATGQKTDLANFVITVEDIEGPFSPPEQPAVMEQKELRFVPHVLVILVGTTVEFPNKDPLSHNVFSISDAKRFNFGLYSHGTIRRLKFEKAGVVELLCNVHLEMSGFIVVTKNPYFARTDADGSYRIAGVPPGRHRLRCWHEHFPAQEHMVQVPETGSVTVDFSVGK